MPHHLSINVVPLLPAWAVAVLGAGLLLLLAQGSILLLRKKVPGKWVTILGALRLAIIAVFVVCLLQPVFSFTRSVQRLPDLMVMVDTSQSMANRGGSGDRSRLQEAVANLRSSNLLGDLEKRYN